MTDPPAHSPNPRPGVGGWAAGLVALAYLVAHVPFLAPSLEDIDSINFALGLRHFDPAAHQPHPPGYPVYIALGKLSLAAVRAVRPALPRVESEAVALSLISLLAGGLAIVAAGMMFRLVAGRAPRSAPSGLAIWATVFLAACPLFWMTGVRPMSDMPGLAFALASQVLMLSGHLQPGAFLAALALGIRSQTFWLTMPLLVWLFVRRSAATWRERLRALAMVAAGVLAWGVPLVVASGGPRAYLEALGTQAGEDFAHVDMLWANPTPRRLAFGLIHTFVTPWVSVPLAIVMLVLAVLGALLLGIAARRRSSEAEVGAGGLLAVAFGPYAIFHLIFQETITVRYALPLVAPVVFLAARALAAAGRTANFAAAPLAAVLLLVAMPGVIAYGRDPHPAFRAIADAERRAEDAPPGLVASHFELLRPLQAAADPSLRPEPTRPQREWLALVKYWADGNSRPAWFFANPRRTDLAAIDPRSRGNVVRYRWAVERRPELSGTRPAAVDWYRFEPPGWFLGEGWSLTAETGGVTEATKTGPGFQPILAWVRRRDGPMHMVIGGRHLGEAKDGAAVVELTVDEIVRDRWTISPEERNFLRFLQLPDGLAGPGPYARLKVVSLPAIRGTVPRRVPIAVRQFDIQPATQIVFGFGAGWHEDEYDAGFGAGWHEDEYDAGTGQQWRWTADRAVLRVSGPPHPIRVRIRAESPLRYFDDPPAVTLSAGGRELARARPSADFELEAAVPVDAWRDGSADIALETTRTFSPVDTGRSSDRRRLGLRVFEVRVERAR
jgi:hypothetical protein